jgi:hypothetical protein
MNLQFGAFNGDPLVRLLCDGRNVQLLAPLVYTDPDGRVWTAPEDYISDGASIPPALWAFVGGPWEGSYRIAAILHDYVCDYYQTIEERKAGDRMFRTAALCAGGTEGKAQVLYFGVSAGTAEAEKEGRDHGPKAFDSPGSDDPGVGWH